MIPFDRHREILSLLEKHHSMTVKRLAELLHASEPTLRRDLVILEKQGHVNRVFGGAVLAGYASTHLPLSTRQQANRLAKADVAAKAAKCITDGSVILLSGGSTIQLMLPHLQRLKKLTVISHSLSICRAALEMGHSVYCIGGALNLKDYSTSGYHAEAMLQRLHAEMMFFSCTGLSAEGEMTGVFEQGIAYLRTALLRSDRRFMLCDSSKLGHTYPHHLADAEEIDGIFCDVALPREIEERIGRNRPYPAGEGSV